MMDEKIKKQLNEYDAQQSKIAAESELRMRKQVLFETGMYDMKKDYNHTKPTGKYPYYDKVSGKPFYPEYWNLSDEEYAEVKKHIPEKVLQSIIGNDCVKVEGVNYNAENMVDKASKIILYLGYAAVILFFILSFGDIEDLFDFDEFEISIFATGIATGFVCFVTYAMMQLVRNISIKLNR